MANTEEITIAETYHSLLENSLFGFLSTMRERDGFISTNPVGFVWDGEHIRISTLKSRIKYQSLAADARVTFCLMSNKDIMNYIEVRGYATLQDDADRSFSRTQFMRATGEEPPADLDPPGAERAIITIHPHKVSSPRLYGGRFHKD